MKIYHHDHLLLRGLVVRAFAFEAVGHTWVWFSIWSYRRL